MLTESTTKMRRRKMWQQSSDGAPAQRLQLSVLEVRGEAEQSAAADEGTKDTALLTLRPHQTCSEQLAD